MKHKQPIGNKIKSLVLMEVSWQMWKTKKNYLLKKTIIAIFKQLCEAKGVNITKNDIEQVIANSSCYRTGSNEKIYFVSSSFMAYFLAKRLYLSLRNRKMKSVYKLLHTRCYGNDTLYFLSMLDQNTHTINETLQAILRNDYVENVTENALHIYCTTAQFKKGFKLQQTDSALSITNFNLTQNLDFSLEVKNNTIHHNDTRMAKSFFDQGLHFLKENRYFEALAPFFAAKALDPDCQKAANNLAIVFKNLGSIPIAKQMAQKVLLEEPDNYRAKQHLKYLDYIENQPKQISDSSAKCKRDN
jgi:tetratricopeptide (TPR) repeat protein